ncbi:helix-turn-helix domain-containing protein [Actinokineospora soli]|uniref:Helix-turn-helix domain-containing protein n=1 Tax=Actinokineospora soli TaxID=1048753 RepID=A0ABW2TTS9_9PSEU
MSLREMARRVDLSPSFVSQVELGRAAPSVGTLYAMVAELGLSLDALMAGDPAPRSPFAAGRPAARPEGRRRSPRSPRSGRSPACSGPTSAPTCTSTGCGGSG